MAKRTRTLTMFPWEGGVVTSLDEGLLQPGQLTVGDNIVYDYRNAKARREGINYDWDNGVFEVTSRSSSGTTRTLVGTFTNTGIAVGDKITIRQSTNAQYDVAFGAVTAISGSSLSYTGTGALSESSTPELTATWGNKVVGGIDYWFGNQDSRAQYLVTVLDNGAVFRTSNGVRVRILDSGLAWTIPTTGLTEANLEILNNLVIIAVSGVTNQMKYWNGNTGEPLRDLPGVLPIVSVSRASSGTTRTLVLGTALTQIDNGETIVIGGGNANYIGTYTLLSGSGTTTITYTAATSLTEGTTADTTILVATFAPLALFIRQHQGRLFCNDKTNLDRLHYSAANEPFVWNGEGTSGALDLGIGDGDPAGLTGISPTFKGDLFVGKRTKLYRLVGNDPDLYQIIKISNGIGFISHQAIAAIDNDDIIFVSERGFHALSAVDSYGDFTASFLSKDIQKSFVEDWEPARRRYIKAAYLPEINSAAFAVSEDGADFNNSLWLFNIEKKSWFRWPDIECETIIAAQDLDRKRIYFGTLNGRLAQTFSGSNQDTLADGTQVNIISKIVTGMIFTDGNPTSVKGFKRIMVIFRGQGTYTVNVSVKIDNFSEQSLAFLSNEDGAVLGTFVLGEDVLGGSFVLAPYSLPIDGFGRAIKVTVEQSDLNTGLAIQGLVIEFEGEGDQPETRNGDND